ncbi:hypothetical protein llap_7734 [Limosa lapponica baueri]|uniref:Uncharacterized protein n=1 Tax=Limosa lapponica baueri TaxID=1758121 RepID=A0A2I0U7B4_LIMLA|nr:hypothetical protein llap_7734 [Limosa lapponica baueri]
MPKGGCDPHEKPVMEQVPGRTCGPMERGAHAGAGPGIAYECVCMKARFTATEGSMLKRTSGGPTPLLKQSHLEQIAQDHVQMAVEYLQGLGNAEDKTENRGAEQGGMVMWQYWFTGTVPAVTTTEVRCIVMVVSNGSGQVMDRHLFTCSGNNDEADLCLLAGPAVEKELAVLLHNTSSQPWHKQEWEFCMQKGIGILLTAVATAITILAGLEDNSYEERDS